MSHYQELRREIFNKDGLTHSVSWWRDDVNQDQGGEEAMKLYDCQIAPNPRRVRIFLAEKGVEIERVEFNLVEGDNLKPDFLAINPRGPVPTLILDDSTALDEVVAISRWIEETYPDPPLMATNACDRVA
jgi:glutathione S-transferase